MEDRMRKEENKIEKRCEGGNEERRIKNDRRFSKKIEEYYKKRKVDGNGRK